MSHPQGKRLLVFAIASVLTALACHDEEIVGPRMKSPHVLSDSRNKPFGEFDLEIPSDNSWPSYGALALTSTSINLPANQWVVLTVMGGVQLQISSLCSSYPGCPSTATHAGQTIDALGLYPSFLQVGLSGAGYANIPLYYDDQGVPTALVWGGSGGVLSASRNGIQDGTSCYAPWPDPNTGITGCPPPNGTDIFFFWNAYTMTGTQTLTAALVDPLVVHGTPTTIHPGDSVTFTAALVASIYKNGNTWTWVAGEAGNRQQNQITTDPPSGGVLVGCNASPCVYAPTQSGRMYVQSTDYYGHPMRGSSEYISINSGKLTVTADPKTFRAEDPVTFEASTTDSSAFTIEGWEFQPDFSVPHFSPCPPSLKTCTINLPSSGTMFVTALVNGNHEIAEVHVSVVTCLTGDSVLDNPVVRDSINKAWNRTHPGLPDESRVEQDGLGLVPAGHLDSTIYEPLSAALNDNCSSSWPTTFVLPGTYVRFFMHLHPNVEGDPAHYCKYLGGVQPPGTYYVGGPSGPDWIAATSLDSALSTFRVPGQSAIPSYAIDAEHAYRYMPNTSANHRDSKHYVTFPYNPASPTGCL